MTTPRRSLLVAHGWAKVLPVRSITVLVFMSGRAQARHVVRRVGVHGLKPASGNQRLRARHAHSHGRSPTGLELTRSSRLAEHNSPAPPDELHKHVEASGGGFVRQVGFRSDTVTTQS